MIMFSNQADSAKPLTKCLALHVEKLLDDTFRKIMN